MKPSPPGLPGVLLGSPGFSGPSAIDRVQTQALRIEQRIVGFVSIDLLQTPHSFVQCKRVRHSMKAPEICSVWNLGGQRSAKP